MLKLRPYQDEAVKAVEDGLAGGLQRVATVLPTGAGKTVVFARLIERFREREPRQRAMVLAHRTELIDQAVQRLADVAPGLKTGVIKANRNETLAPVLVASVQTLAGDNRRRMLRNVGLIVVDECHHAVAPTYLDILRHYGALEGSGAVAAGYTATMSRGDEKALGAVWQDIVYHRTIADMIAEGYLVRPRGRRVWVEDLDLSHVRKSRGDYAEGALGAAIEASMAPEAVVKAWREHADGRPTVLFAPTVATAQLFAEAFAADGVATGVVWGAQPAQERAETLARLRSGEITVVCNCMVMTEGTDLPMLSCAIIARPTLHAGLYVQMAGRVLRLWPGKDDALILDVVGASAKHALTAHVELFGTDDLERDEAEPVEQVTLETELEEEELAGPDLGWVDGPVRSTEVDLFHGSDSAWLRTRGGIWFIPAGDRYIAIIPNGRGGYDVTAMHRYQYGTGRFVARSVSDLAYAMAWAEQDVTTAELMTARRDRGWRMRRSISDKQRALAARYGIAIGPGMTSGQVSDQISLAMASARIDPRVRV